MDTAARDYYPPGDLRVSDAERDLAVSELTEAFRAGRITAGEFDQRSGQALRARTGKELTALLADLPLVDRAPAARATVPERVQRGAATRIIIGASIGAVCFAAVSATNALSSGPAAAQREFMQQMLARQGLSVPVPPAPGFNWPAVITPAAIAVLLVVVIIFLRVTRARRPRAERERPGS